MPDTLRMNHAIGYGYHSEHPLQPITGDGFHYHLHYEIYYFHEGVCTFMIGQQIHQLLPGDVLLMHGRTPHRSHPQPGYPYIRSTLHFDPGLLGQYIQEEHVPALLYPFEQSGNRKLRLPMAERSELEILLKQLARLPSEQSGRVPLPFMMKLCDILALLSACAQQQEPSDIIREGKEQYAYHIVDYIEQHYMHEITLEQIADHLHLSKTYAASLFKEWSGTTIFKYLYNRRINQAQLLLQYQQELSISEISRLSGFKQPAHFSRLFKETVGCSPESYRLKLSFPAL